MGIGLPVVAGVTGLASILPVKGVDGRMNSFPVIGLSVHLALVLLLCTEEKESPAFMLRRGERPRPCVRVSSLVAGENDAAVEVRMGEGDAPVVKMSLK